MNSENTIDKFITGKTGSVNENELMSKGFLREREKNLYMTVKLERKPVEGTDTDTLILTSIVNDVYSGDIDLTRRMGAAAVTPDTPTDNTVEKKIDEEIIAEMKNAIFRNTKIEDTSLEEDASLEKYDSNIKSYYEKIMGESNINNIYNDKKHIKDFFEKNNIKSVQDFKDYIKENLKNFQQGGQSFKTTANVVNAAKILNTPYPKNSGGYVSNSRPFPRRKSLRRSILKSVRRSSRPSYMKTLKSRGQSHKTRRNVKYASILV